MTAIDVDGLRFEFDDTWTALKWDDHVAYRHGLNGHGGTKAIDILALRHEDELWLIECGSSQRSTHPGRALVRRIGLQGARLSRCRRLGARPPVPCDGIDSILEGGVSR
jgi:hypothetical protein